MPTELTEALARVIASHRPGSDEEAARIVRDALAAGFAPSAIIDEGLVAGMADVGRRFRENEIFVPEVLVSARAMHAALGILEPLLAASGHEPAGRFLIGTVKGDIHDIGKNLVVMMLRGAGFLVRDLGVNVALAKFDAAITEFRPHIVGMSALLTTTMGEMERNLRSWSAGGARGTFAVMVGGAPVTEEWAREIGADGHGGSAAEAVDVALALLQRGKSDRTHGS